MRKNPYILRCYARPEKDYILGMCVDLDIAVRGSSVEEVKTEMNKAIQSFFSSLDKDNFKDVFPRKAPFFILLDYYTVAARVHCLQAKQNFQIFCEQLIPKSFEVSPLCA